MGELLSLDQAAGSQYQAQMADQRWLQAALRISCTVF